MRNGWADPIIDEAQTGGNGFQTAKSRNNLCEQQPFRWWQFSFTEPKHSLLDSPVAPNQLDDSGYQHVISREPDFSRQPGQLWIYEAQQ